MTVLPTSDNRRLRQLRVFTLIITMLMANSFQTEVVLTSMGYGRFKFNYNSPNAFTTILKVIIQILTMTFSLIWKELQERLGLLSHSVRLHGCGQ